MLRNRLIGGYKGASLLAFCVLLFGCNKGAEQTTGDPSPEKAAERPNILLIMADDMGYSDIGPFGSEIKTPNLDALAAAGVSLTNFHVNTTCSPTRSMLFSGADSHWAGYGTMPGLETPEQLGQPGYEKYLNDRVVAFSELLQDSGYHTYITGKWDQGGRNGQGKGPHERGFDRSFILVEGLADHYRNVGVYPILSPVNYLEDGEPVELPKDFYSSRSYTDKLIEYIDQDADEGNPFFAFLSFTAPHYPIQAPQADIAEYAGVYDAGYQKIREARVEKQKALGIVGEDWGIPQIHASWPKWSELDEKFQAVEVKRMAAYAAMITNMDRHIGRILAYLDSKGLRENTLVIFMSDNGPDQSNPMDTGKYVSDDYEGWLAERYSIAAADVGQEGSFTWYGPAWASVSSTPFKFHKHFMTKGGVVVPFIASYPSFSQGTQSNAFASVLDLLPTFLELADVEHPGTSYKGRAVAKPIGQSLVGLLSGEAEVVHDENYVFALEIFDRRMVQKGDWKMTWENPPWGKDKDWSLYHLANDPTEMRDVSADNPGKLQELKAEWDSYVERNGIIPNEGFVLPVGATRSHYESMPSDK